MNDWRAELPGIQAQYRAAKGVDEIEDAFREKVEQGLISLPHSMIIYCAKEDDLASTRHVRGRILLVGNIIRRENPKYFRYAWDAVQAQDRGVLFLNGNQAAENAGERMWGTLRYKLRCPSSPHCSYAPDVYGLELDKLAMFHAMLGRNEAPLTD